MIDPYASAQTTTAPRPDPAYQSWQGSMKRATMRFDLNDRTAGPIPTFGSMIHETALAAQSHSAYAPSSPLDTAQGKPDIAIPSDESDEFSFGDVIDMINPLHHLPVVGMVYRKLTGDVIKPMSNIIGGAIFGGPVGAVTSTVNALVKSTTGRDVAENAFALVGLDMTPEGRGTDIIYSDVALVDANKSETAKGVTAYQTASGQKNFAARSASTQSWNA